MKKIITLMLVIGVVLFTSQTQAQSAVLMPLKAGDTLTAAAGLDSVTKIIPTSAAYSAFGIQVNATKLSGTVSAKAYLYGSLDGLTYLVTDSSAAFTNTTNNVAWFTKTSTPYSYYKVQVRPATSDATTQSFIVRVYYTLRK